MEPAARWSTTVKIIAHDARNDKGGRVGCLPFGIMRIATRIKGIEWFQRPGRASERSDDHEKTLDRAIAAVMVIGLTGCGGGEPEPLTTGDLAPA